jgi:hypothetical protein
VVGTVEDGRWRLLRAGGGDASAGGSWVLTERPCCENRHVGWSLDCVLCCCWDGTGAGSESDGERCRA